MLKIYAMVAATMFALTDRVADRKRDERGFGTLELVVLGLGLLVFATTVIAVFKTAIDSRTEKIK